MKMIHKKTYFSPFRIIIFGFALMILTGSILLMLPVSSRMPGGAPFADAVFTATSAVCVTGLVVHDTAVYWSEFGQFVIMLLIQVGGMGVVTSAVAVTIISGKKIGLMQRSTLQEALSAPQVGGVVRLTGFIIKTSIMIELIGAAVLSVVFIKEFGVIKGVWYSLFHSVSAFCNAGFDLMGVKEPCSSLTSLSSNPVINITVMLLIIIGGIGFLTWEDIKTNKLHIKKYRLQSKLILTVTAVLILLPAIYFYFGEFGNGDMPFGERILGALFQSVTPRTAGFNTVDLSAMSEAGQAIIILLMLIGGSPGSTAGGMKTTTAAVLICSAAAVFRHKESTVCFGRRIAAEAVTRATTIAVMYITLFFAGGIIISRIEAIPLGICLFETASAIGTVGLSLGITPALGAVSRAILIMLMFFGRVGGLTLIFAAMSNKGRINSQLPQEKITVG
ncbi:MAG: potassium transporter TrkG [Clostridiales bacterium]|nr:potassium transporter TrkG [Clostridiales bacterium]